MAALMRSYETQARLPSLPVVLGTMYTPGVVHSDGLKIATTLPRQNQRNRVLTALNRSKIAAILEPRQCGKTTLARQIMETIPATYLDLEFPRDAARLSVAGLKYER